MAVIDSMLLDLNSHLTNANVCKDMVLQQLKKDGIITEETQIIYTEKWQMIIIKPSWFQRWKTVFSKDNNDYQYKLVKFED